GMAVGDFIKYREEQGLPIIGPRDQLPKWDFGPIRREMLSLPDRTPVNHSCLAISGPVRVSALGYTVVFSADGVTVASDLRRSIIVVDGDIEAGSLSWSIIITRGTVKARYGDIENSVIIAGGNVQCLAEHRHASKSIVRENCKDFLGWVRFFEMADTGMEIAPAERGLKIKSVVKDQPPAKAGLLAGDVITAIDKTAIKDAEQFRRLLRKAVAARKADLTIERIGSSIDAMMSFTDWEPPARKK